MNGCTIPYTPIAVDFWKVRQLQRVRLFFLSHAHLDPSCGITSSWSMPIYCSLISKKILLQRFQLNQNVVHALELNVRHVIPMTSNEDVTMTVTLIDANHCPGSVMFLFEGYFGRILYTGDFRFTEEMLTTSPFNSVIEKPIDVLYMDNTYCSPKCNFPTREVAKQEVLTAIEQHPKEKVIIGLRNLGKEDLLTAIATHFNVTIKVSEERFKTLELLNVHEQFSTSDANSRIEVVQMVDVTRQNMDVWNKEKPTIAILPTAIFTALGDFPFHGQRDMIVIPYSDHSSYMELHRFVAAVKPKSIIPIVKADVRDPLTAALLDRTSVECFLEYLDKTPMTNYHIPPSVLELMNQTHARGGSSRKTSVGRKASVIGSRTNTKNRKNNENIKCASSCTPAPLEHKSKTLVDVNSSVASSGQDRGLEKPRIDAFSSKNGAFQECLPVTKFNRCGSKLIRCASSDRLFSPSHRPCIKLRLNRVASPDLRMQLKRKIGSDVKRPYAGLHPNLVRTRRVRLCNAHLCRTFCHSSGHCKTLLSDNVYRTSGLRSDSVLELNRGEETMYNFRSDIGKTCNLGTKEFKTNSDRESGACSAVSDFEVAKENVNNKQTAEECIYPKSSNASLVCLSSVALDTSDTLVNSSCIYTNVMPLADAIDLRGRGPVEDDYSAKCTFSTSSSSKLSWMSNFHGFSDLLVANSFRNIGDQTARGLQREPSLNPSELRMAQGPSDQSDMAPVSTCGSAFSFTPLNNRNRTSFDCGRPVQISFAATLEEANKLTDEPGIFMLREQQQQSLSASTAGTDRFKCEHNPHTSCSEANGSIDCTEKKRQKLDASVLPSSDDLRKLDIGKDESDLRICPGGKIELHMANTVSENTLPPKKNWKQRFGMTQLHKVSQENKWVKMEQNGLSKLLIADAASKNSKDLTIHDCN